MRAHNDFDVKVEKIDHIVSIKLSADYLEINLRLNEEEISGLSEIDTADWNRRGSIRLGSCLNEPVFWSAAEEGCVSMLIGADDEVWDIGLVLSAATFQLIRREVERRR